MLARHEARLRAVLQRLVQEALGGATLVTVGTLACACTSSSPAGEAADASVAIHDAGTAGVRDATTEPGSDGSVSDEPTDACTGPFVVTDGPNDGSGCEYYQRVGCGLPTILSEHPDGNLDGCFVYLGICYSWCTQYGGAVKQCSVVECDDAGNLAEGGPVTIDCVSSEPRCTGTVGRRPRRLQSAPALASKDAAGAWLADCARLEAASVRAFRDLKCELETLGAPRALVLRAEESARDEVRHARVVSRLARAHGAKPSRATVTSRRASHDTRAARAEGLAELARDNAVEGCVRETFGAFVATWQSMHAQDISVARAMKRIARDETRHAALAWSIAEWLAGELGQGARARTKRAIRDAMDALRCEVVRANREVAREMGVPTGAVATRMIEEIGRLADSLAG